MSGTSKTEPKSAQPDAAKRKAPFYIFRLRFGAADLFDPVTPAKQKACHPAAPDHYDFHRVHLRISKFIFALQAETRAIG